MTLGLGVCLLVTTAWIIFVGSLMAQKSEGDILGIELIFKAFFIMFWTIPTLICWLIYFMVN